MSLQLSPPSQTQGFKILILLYLRKLLCNAQKLFIRRLLKTFPIEANVK
jgi:hypothetical protein